MLPLRKEIDDLFRSCEHLIATALSADAVPFTAEEIKWVTYCGTEMTNLANLLLHTSRLQINHQRQAIWVFAATCEALLLMDDFSDDERESIRRSVSDITTKILI